MSISGWLLRARGTQQESGTLPWYVYLEKKMSPPTLSSSDNSGLEMLTQVQFKSWQKAPLKSVMNGLCWYDFRGKKSSFPFFPPICLEQLASRPIPIVPSIVATGPEPISHCSALGICSVTPLLPCSLQSEVIGPGQLTWLLITLPRILCELKWVITPRKATASGCRQGLLCLCNAETLGWECTPGPGLPGAHPPLQGAQAPSHALSTNSDLFIMETGKRANTSGCLEKTHTHTLTRIWHHTLTSS